MLDSFYRKTFKINQKLHIGVNTSRFCHLLRYIIMIVIPKHYEICRLLVVYRFYCIALYHS